MPQLSLHRSIALLAAIFLLHGAFHSVLVFVIIHEINASAQGEKNLVRLQAQRIAKPRFEEEVNYAVS